MKSTRVVALILALGTCTLPIGVCMAAPPKPGFEGNKSVGAKHLLEEIREQLDRFEERGYAEVEINDAAYFITQYYRRRGYPFVTVTYQIDRDVRPPLVMFQIEEGPLIRLVGVKLSGVKAFPPQEIRDMLLPRTRLGKHPPFEQSRVDQAARAIIGKYRQAGFPDAKIVRKDVEFDREEGKAILHISLSEGIRYMITNIELEGRLVYDEDELHQQTRPFLDQPFSLRRGLLASSAARLFYMNRGHRECEVGWDYAADPRSGQVTLAIHISPGPRFTIREVSIEGNERTRDEFIRKRVALSPGDVYSYDAETATSTKLIRTGLFDRVSLAFETVDNDQLDLSVEVTETRARGAQVSLGYGSYEGVRGGVGFYDINVAGSGKQARLQLGISQVGYETELSLREPSLMGSPWQSQLRLFQLRREEPSFTRIDFGLDASISRPFLKSWRHFAGYEISTSRATAIEADTAEESNRLNTAQLFAGVAYDSRDSALSTTQGTFYSLRGNLSANLLGSEVEFLRFNQQVKHFWKLMGECVAGIAVNLGTIFPTGATKQIPIQERYFLGGANSVRSFREGELGPKDAGGTPLGAEAFTSAAAEFRFPMLNNLHGAVFADAGSVTKDADRFGIGRYSFALGAGLRYYLPIGPIRIDYGWNPDPAKDEDEGALHVSVGFSF